MPGDENPGEMRNKAEGGWNSNRKLSGAFDKLQEAENWCWERILM